MTGRGLRIGLVGAGGAGTSTLLHLTASESFEVVGVADVGSAARAAAEDRFGVPTFATTGQLYELAAPEAVYIASPSELHVEHAESALTHGIHVLVEKPVALDLPDADRLVDLARNRGVHLMVCHRRSADPGIRTMRSLIESGRFGAVRGVHIWHFSDWIYRPRSAHDLDTARGGGAVMRQAIHHFDMMRYLTGGTARSISGAVARWDPDRPGDGSYAAFVDFSDEVVGTLAFGGYDHFASSELSFDVGMDGSTLRSARIGAAARDFAARTDEVASKRAENERRSRRRGSWQQPIYGTVLVNCERGDMRLSATGVLVYSAQGRVEVPLVDQRFGFEFVLDELRDAVIDGIDPCHDGVWGMGNLEMCLALIASSNQHRAPQELAYQMPWGATSKRRSTRTVEVKND